MNCSHEHKQFPGFIQTAAWERRLGHLGPRLRHRGWSPEARARTQGSGGLLAFSSLLPAPRDQEGPPPLHPPLPGWDFPPQHPHTSTGAQTDICNDLVSQAKLTPTTDPEPTAALAWTSALDLTEARQASLPITAIGSLTTIASPLLQATAMVRTGGLGTHMKAQHT